MKALWLLFKKNVAIGDTCDIRLCGQRDENNLFR